MTLSCKWPFNTKNERNNASQLDFSFFPTLGFPTRIRIQIEFVRPHVSDTYQDYFYFLWEYWKLSMRRGINVAILNTIFTVQLTLAYPDLASTRFQIHSVFKNFHSGERIKKVADTYAGSTGYVWTKA